MGVSASHALARQRLASAPVLSKDDCDISSSLKLGKHRSQTRSLGRLRRHTLPLVSPQLPTRDKERVVDDSVQPRILFAICTSPQCQPTAYTGLQHQHEGRGPEAVPAANGRTAPEELPGLQQTLWFFFRLGLTNYLPKSYLDDIVILIIYASWII